MTYWHEYRNLFRNRSVLLLLSSEVINSIGSTLTFFAMMAQVMHLTDRDLYIGMVMMMEITPAILFGFVAGIIADRFDRKKIMIVSNLLRAGIISLLLFSDQLWQIYLIAFIDGIVANFFQPAKRALQPTLVKSEEYVTLNSLFSLTNSTMQIFRPAISGLVVAFLGAKMAYTVDVITFILAAGLTLGIKAPPFVEEKKERSQQMWQDFKEGIRYIVNKTILKYIFIFQIFFTLVMSMQGALTFLYVEKYMAHGGNVEQITGYLFSMIGIGGFMGAFLSKWMIERIGGIQLLLATTIFDGVMVVWFSWTDQLPIALFIWAFFGIIGAVSSVVIETLIQHQVPEDLRGRVYGVMGPLTGPISLLSIGGGTTLSQWFGPRLVFMSAGLGEILLGIFGRIVPAYKKMENQ
ncbi:MAG: MFS transporter [Tepidibacillus sp.]|uniref:MFS transporter n=1 Tax=Tepidibacillus sp. HK-1 TaxID=1883407 RepID=UPI000852EDAF|nr:MFS transporter [Tepidibacillus sp. HK-1]GBF12597.1 putative bacilysin exporter BacE [Tepidibacillus sp. HK-1]